MKPHVWDLLGGTSIFHEVVRFAVYMFHMLFDNSMQITRADAGQNGEIFYIAAGRSQQICHNIEMGGRNKCANIKWHFEFCFRLRLPTPRSG